MGLGPSLSIRQSQQLMLTPQLRQAIKLLQLSNLELEAFIAEELSKNPLLEARSATRATRRLRQRISRTTARSDEAPDDPGADDLIRGQVEDDRPLDVDWTAEALETDSFSDVVTSSAATKPLISIGFNIRLLRWPNISSTSSTAFPGRMATWPGSSPKPSTRPAI